MSEKKYETIDGRPVAVRAGSAYIGQTGSIYIGTKYAGALECLLNVSLIREVAPTLEEVTDASLGVHLQKGVYSGSVAWITEDPTRAREFIAWCETKKEEEEK